MFCFACKKPIRTQSVNCPHCGYRFTVDENNYCPNSNYGVCSITENMCTRGTQFQLCPTKLEADKNSPF